MEVRNRDQQLDRLRGFAMIWVLVVHVIYWGNFIPSNIFNVGKSFILFEMPLLFFITGASNEQSSLSNVSDIKTYLSYIKKRFLRVFVPYWAYALICAILSIAVERLLGNANISYLLKILISWIVPINTPISRIPYLTWALWFIPVYFGVIALVPLMKNIKRKSINFAMTFLGLVVMVFLVVCWKHIAWLQYLMFYSIWTYAGMFFCDIRRNISKRNGCFIIIVCIVISLMSLIAFYYTVGGGTRYAD